MTAYEFIHKLGMIYNRSLNDLQIKEYTNTLNKYDEGRLERIFDIIKVQEERIPSLAVIIRYIKENMVSDGRGSTEPELASCDICNHGVVTTIRPMYGYPYSMVSACVCESGKKLESKWLLSVLTCEPNFFKEGHMVRQNKLIKEWILRDEERVLKNQREKQAG